MQNIFLAGSMTGPGEMTFFVQTLEHRLHFVHLSESIDIIVFPYSLDFKYTQVASPHSAGSATEISLLFIDDYINADR